MSNELTLHEKIEKLKAQHTTSHSDAKQLIESWENRLAELETTKDWLQHPITQRLRELAEEQIQYISHLLASDENLSEPDRRALFREKQAHFVYLALMQTDPNGEIKAIEENINYEL